MSDDYDAIVIGAGIIGAAVGFELAKKGWKTLNVDKAPAAGYGSTGASCAIIRTHYSTLEGCALAYEGYFHWDDWAAYVGDHDERGRAEFHKTGCLVTKTERNDHLRTITGLMDELGIPWEDLSPEQVARRMPLYDTRSFWPVKRIDDEGFGEATGEAIAGAVFFPYAGYISDPQLASHNIQRAAEAAGAEFLFNAEVTAIRRSDDRVAGITLADGREIDAPVVVNVAGPHSHKINALAGVAEGMRISTRALKVEVVHVPSPAGFDYERDGFVVSDGDVGCYSRPEVGNNILVGSEDPECDPRVFVDPDDYDESFTEQGRHQVLRVAQRIPSLGVPSRLKGVVSLYDVTEDWIPVYDASDLDGFYLAIGTSGNQFKNAPVVGAMMAHLIEAAEAGQDHDADPVTFTLPYTGREVDIGFFSRNRPVNEDSSFSVLG
jgi:sarcosine oxidase subunit beta